VTEEEVAALADEAETVDRETYIRLFPERAPYLPGPVEGLDDRWLVVGAVPRRATRRPLLAEVISILLPWASGYASSKVADAAIAWARERWRKERDEKGHAHARHVVIYGPDGHEVIRRVVIDENEREEP
jgi:hypothetical protein